MEIHQGVKVFVFRQGPWAIFFNPFFFLRFRIFQTFYNEHVLL